MLVNLSDVLASEGRRETKDVSLEMTAFRNRDVDYEVLEKSPVHFTFSNIKPGKAKIEGNCKLTFKTCCDRCLTEVPMVLELDFERYVVSPEAGDDEDADDLSFMDGYQLNVETFVYNEVLGNWPAKILCNDDCKGICPVCGQNLNMGDCGCDTFVPDPRMAVIQDIFNANKEV